MYLSIKKWLSMAGYIICFGIGISFSRWQLPPESKHHEHKLKQGFSLITLPRSIARTYVNDSKGTRALAIVSHQGKTMKKCRLTSDPILPHKFGNLTAILIRNCEIPKILPCLGKKKQSCSLDFLAQASNYRQCQKAERVVYGIR